MGRLREKARDVRETSKAKRKGLSFSSGPGLAIPGTKKPRLQPVLSLAELKKQVSKGKKKARTPAPRARIQPV